MPAARIVAAVIALGAGLALAQAPVRTFEIQIAARRSQYPLAALMVAYTMLSLWILAQPIVESAK